MIFAGFEPLILGTKHCALTKWAAGASTLLGFTRAIILKMLIFAGFEPLTPRTEHCALTKWATGASIFFEVTEVTREIILKMCFLLDLNH